MNTPLYQIVDFLQEVFRRLEENGGEITEELSAELGAVEIALRDKVEATALWIRSKEGDSEQIAAEIERLKARKESVGKEIESLKEYLRDQLNRAGTASVKTPLVTVWRQTGAGTVNVVDMAILPDQFKTGKITLPYNELPEELLDIAEINFNRRAIGEALKSGAVPGAELTPGREYLRIK